MIRQIDDHVSVAPQISPEEVDAIVAAGYAAIINNRPDDEEPGQPSGAEIASAADAAGIPYREIPVGHSGISGNQIEAMASALTGANGPVLAYCRSGTRSANLWALARARMGDDPAELTAKAAVAGYDLRGIRAMLDTLAADAKAAD